MNITKQNVTSKYETFTTNQDNKDAIEVKENQDLNQNPIFELVTKKIFVQNQLLIKEAKKIIQQNIFANLSINELAGLCGMSISTFQRTFYNIFEQTYLNTCWLRDRRPSFDNDGW